MFFDTVIFDFDYTLADGTDAIVACYNHAFRAFGYPDGEREAVRRTVGMTVRDSIKLLTGCKDPESIEKMRLLFREKADEILAKNTFLFDGAKPLLRRLKEAGVKTAIVSSKERVRIEESLALGGAEGLVDHIIGGPLCRRQPYRLRNGKKRRSPLCRRHHRNHDRGRFS